MSDTDGHTPGPWIATSVRDKGYDIDWVDLQSVPVDLRPSGRTVAKIDFARSGAKRGMAVQYYPSPADHANARLIARAPEIPTMAAELDRLRAVNAQMREALKGKDHKWADKLWEFLLAEYEAIPTNGEAVTADVRPHFDALCEFMAARDTALTAAAEADNG